MDDLDGLSMSPVFLLAEFFDSLRPLTARVRDLPEDERWDFYVRLIPLLIGHCRQIGLPHPHETALFVCRLVEDADPQGPATGSG